MVAAVVLATAAVGFTAPAIAAPEPAPPATADEYPIIELVTMGIGDLIWERHGHIALCVRYPRPERDRCYNYGVATFDKPISMAWGFARGADTFWVAASPPDRMLEGYRYADRSIWVQRLPLTMEQKRQVIAKLAHDVKVENRYYSYDHFFDNCTTRIRDIIDEATGGLLSASHPPAPRSFREYARDGFFGNRGALLITDIAMGRITDRQPTHYEAMFLPDYLREAVHEQMGVEPVLVYERRGPPHVPSGPTGRGLLLVIILLATAPAWATLLWGRFSRLGLALALGPPALIGLILWSGAIISPIPYVRWNESVLIFVPFDLAVVFLTGRRLWIYAAARVAMLLLFSILLAVGVFVMPLWVPLLWPLIPLATIALPPLLRRGRQVGEMAGDRDGASDEELGVKKGKPGTPAKKAKAKAKR